MMFPHAKFESWRSFLDKNSSSFFTSSPSISVDKWTLFVSKSKEANDRKWPEKRVFDESCNRFSISVNPDSSPRKTESTKTWELSHSFFAKMWKREIWNKDVKGREERKERRVAWRRNARFWVGFKTRPKLGHQSLSREEKRKRIREKFPFLFQDSCLQFFSFFSPFFFLPLSSLHSRPS